jgi:hypothetical protein
MQMAGAIIEGLLVVLLWVGLWGIIEMIIDKLAKDDKVLRFTIYIIAVIISIFFLWLLGVKLI